MEVFVYVSSNLCTYSLKLSLRRCRDPTFYVGVVTYGMAFHCVYESYHLILSKIKETFITLLAFLFLVFTLKEIDLLTDQETTQESFVVETKSLTLIIMFTRIIDESLGQMLVGY